MMNSHNNRALADLRDTDIWTAISLGPMDERVENQLDYLESNFGYEALNNGLYTFEECIHARALLNKWQAVYE